MGAAVAVIGLSTVTYSRVVIAVMVKTKVFIAMVVVALLIVRVRAVGY